MRAYENRGVDWAARRRPVRRADARAFARRVGAGRLRIDLGCGAGRYTADLGAPVVGLDAARAMLDLCRSIAPHAPLVRADLEALPFGRQTLYGAWANMSYVHVPSARLPLALADLQRALVVGAPLDLQMLRGEYEGHRLPQDDVGGRFFASWTRPRLVDVLVGAGFDLGTVVTDKDVVRAQATRARTLPDVVGTGMHLLVVGLNPSLFSADAGVGYARPGNRFWPAARTAGLVSKDRDPLAALIDHGIGMTDIVKRATASAAELGLEDYRAGMARVERLVGRLRPGAVCFVGLSGWRAAFDAHAQAGPQTRRLGGRPVYVMPSTSGLNAHAQLPDLVMHLRAARGLVA
jgi:TDG/mug DNA glycosylase family protein